MTPTQNPETQEVPKMRQVTIWHNNTGRPIELWSAGVNPTTGKPFPAQTYEGCSGISPFNVGSPDEDERFAAEFAYTVERYGAAAVENNDAPFSSNHHTIGCGVGHDDARWAESRFLEGSMAAYYENGEPFDGRRIAGLK
jgi:hypothetical protein